MPKFTHLTPSWYEEARVASGPNYFYAPEDTDAALTKTAQAIRELKSQHVTCAMIYGTSVPRVRNPGNSIRRSETPDQQFITVEENGPCGPGFGCVQPKQRVRVSSGISALRSPL
jgi:hypothetical protein